MIKDCLQGLYGGQIPFPKELEPLLSVHILPVAEAVPCILQNETSSKSDTTSPILSHKPFSEWKMELDDAPILRELFKGFQPRRHLEFGTWQGFGVNLVCELTDATVWTLNLWDGENLPNGAWAYAAVLPGGSNLPDGAVGANVFDGQKNTIWLRTDSKSMIGSMYREAGFGHRVNQIFCDSTKWDTSKYPSDFFDSAFIDGGHTQEIVYSDTKKTLDVLRPGGLILWHDFCPDPLIMNQSFVCRGVAEGITALLPLLKERLSELVWIYPSMVLAGRIKA